MSLVTFSPEISSLREGRSCSLWPPTAPGTPPCRESSSWNVLSLIELKGPWDCGLLFLPLERLLLHTRPRGRWVNRLHVSRLGWWGYHLGPQPLSRCRGSSGSGFPGSTKSSRSRGWACRVHLLRLWHFSTAESTPLGSLERRWLKSKENWQCLINPPHFAELKRSIIALLLGLSPSNYLNHTVGYGCKISVKQYFVNMYTMWFWKSWRTKYYIFIGFDSTNGHSICKTYIRVLCKNVPSGSFLFLLGVSLTPWNLTPAT